MKNHQTNFTGRIRKNHQKIFLRVKSGAQGSEPYSHKPRIGCARRDGGVWGGSAPPAARGLNGGVRGGSAPPAWEVKNGFSEKFTQVVELFLLSNNLP